MPDMSQRRFVRSVVISGASTGIGRATATRLAASGWDVLAGVRRLDAAPTAPGVSGSIRPLLLDVTAADSVNAARAQIAELLGGRPLTALINNAGIGRAAPMERVELASLQEIWEVNVAGVVRLSQALLPLMTRGSRLLIIGSIGDRLTVPHGGPLTSSKWAVASIAEAFRLELRARGIGVTLVEPGSVNSEAVGKVAAAAAETAELISRTDPALASRFERAVGVAMANERTGSTPDVVAGAIERSLRANRSPSRVLVGKHAVLMAAAAAVLPDRPLDWLRLRLFRQPGSAVS